MQSRYQEALENDEALRTFMEKVTTGSGSDEAEAGEGGDQGDPFRTSDR